MSLNYVILGKLLNHSVPQLPHEIRMVMATSKANDVKIK